MPFTPPPTWRYLSRLPLHGRQAGPHHVGVDCHTCCVHTDAFVYSGTYKYPCQCLQYKYVRKGNGRTGVGERLIGQVKQNTSGQTMMKLAEQHL